MAAWFWRVGNCGLVLTGRSGFSSSRSRGVDLWEHPERQLVATCWQHSLIFCTWQGSPGFPDVCKWVTSKNTRSTLCPSIIPMSLFHSLGEIVFLKVHFLWALERTGSNWIHYEYPSDLNPEWCSNVLKHRKESQMVKSTLILTG